MKQEPLPDDFIEQMHEAVIDVEKWALEVKAIVLPASWAQAFFRRCRDDRTIAHYVQAGDDSKFWGHRLEFAFVDHPFASTTLKPTAALMQGRSWA